MFLKIFLSFFLSNGIAFVYYFSIYVLFFVVDKTRYKLEDFLFLLLFLGERFNYILLVLSRFGYHLLYNTVSLISNATKQQYILFFSAICASYESTYYCIGFPPIWNKIIVLSDVVSCLCRCLCSVCLCVCVCEWEREREISRPHFLLYQSYSLASALLQG